MNAQVKPTDIAPPTAQDIAARIASEQEKLIVEGNRDTRLTSRRSQLLAAGNDLELTACETEIQECRTAQTRGRERIELLKTQLAEANKNAEDERLKQLIAGAEQSRVRGVEIITKVYPKLAKQIATAMAELKGCEETIYNANLQLQSAKRIDDMVASVNAARDGGMREPLQDGVNLPTELETAGLHYWERRNPSTELMFAQLGIVR